MEGAGEIEDEILQDTLDELCSSSKWNQQNTKLLITLRLNMENDFNGPKKKCSLWNKISNEMEKKGYNISGPDCHLKYRNLLKTYKKNKDKQKASGEGAINWPYFEAFDEILGHKMNVNVPENLIGDTLNEEEDSVQNKNSQPSTSQKRGELRKRKPDWKEEYFKKKLESKEKEIERKQKEWEEKKEIEKKKVDAIFELSNALKEYNERI